MRIYWFLLLILCLSACGTTGQSFSNGYAAGYHIAKPISCVPYAREKSGIQIRGDAHTWWYQAAGRYARGSVPRVGAVYVLSKTSKLKYGHLSVVKRIINPRTIEVTHSNWGNDKKTRAIIYKRMRVEDVSPNNDWSRARFWNYEENVYGFPYEASGFIYPR